MVNLSLAVLGERFNSSLSMVRYLVYCVHQKIQDDNFSLDECTEVLPEHDFRRQIIDERRYQELVCKSIMFFMAGFKWGENVKRKKQKSNRSVVHSGIQEETQ